MFIKSLGNVNNHKKRRQRHCL